MTTALATRTGALYTTDRGELRARVWCWCGRLEIDRVKCADEIKMERVEVGTNGVRVWRGQHHWREVPVEHLHVPVVAHRPGIHHDGCALGVEDHVAVQADAVVEQQVKQAGLPGGGQGLVTVERMLSKSVASGSTSHSM